MSEEQRPTGGGKSRDGRKDGHASEQKFLPFFFFFFFSEEYFYKNSLSRKKKNTFKP